MRRCTRFCGRGHRRATLAILLASAVLAIPAKTTFALIVGGEGNRPITDPGWPAGVAAIFNHPARVEFVGGSTGARGVVLGRDVQQCEELPLER